MIVCDLEGEESRQQVGYGLNLVSASRESRILSSDIMYH